MRFFWGQRRARRVDSDGWLFSLARRKSLRSDIVNGSFKIFLLTISVLVGYGMCIRACSIKRQTSPSMEVFEESKRRPRSYAVRFSACS